LSKAEQDRIVEEVASLRRLATVEGALREAVLAAIDKELEFARQVNPQMAAGMLRVKEIIEKMSIDAARAALGGGGNGK
jgi:hypothetical protein